MFRVLRQSSKKACLSRTVSSWIKTFSCVLQPIYVSWEILDRSLCICLIFFYLLKMWGRVEMIQKLSFDLETTNSPCCGWTQWTPAVTTICASPTSGQEVDSPRYLSCSGHWPSFCSLADDSGHFWSRSVIPRLSSQPIATSEANWCLICTSERDKQHWELLHVMISEAASEVDTTGWL